MYKTSNQYFETAAEAIDYAFSAAAKGNHYNIDVHEIKKVTTEFMSLEADEVISTITIKGPASYKNDILVAAKR